MHSKTTFRDTLDHLNKYDFFEVQSRLSAGQKKAVDEGYAVMFVYQDQPHDIPWIFRPKRYFLKRSDQFEVMIKKLKKDIFNG